MLLAQQIEHYLANCQALGYSERTLPGKRHALHCFQQWCQPRSLHSAHALNRHHLEAYRRYLYHSQQKNGQPLSLTTQRKRLSEVKNLLAWLAEEEHIPYNPAASLKLPKPHKRLPRGTLLHFERGTILMVEECNPPCSDMGEHLAQVCSTRSGEPLAPSAFSSAAKFSRGIVGIVELAGEIHRGDRVTVSHEKLPKWLRSSAQ